MIGKSAYVIGLLFSILMLLISSIFWMDSVIYSPGLTFMITIIGIIFIYKLFPCEMLMLGFQIFSLLFMLFSNVIIEGGAYIVEQFRYGYMNGSTLVLSFYILLPIFVGVFFLRGLIYQKINISERRINKGFSLLILIGLGIIVIYIFLIAKSRILTLGIGNRFIFWTELGDGVFITLAKYVRAIVPALSSIFGFLFFYSGFKKQKIIMALIFSVIMLLFFITGDKASPFISLFFGFILGMSFSFKNQDIQLHLTFSRLILFLLLFTILIVVVLWGYIVQHGVNIENLYEVFTTRLALQGHVWFGIYELILDKDSSQALSFGNLIHKDTLDFPSGLSYMSYLISEYGYVTDRISRGISFTMGGAAAAIGFSGLYFGLAVFTLLFSLYSFVLAYSYKKVIMGQWIIFLICMTYIVSLNSVVLMGNWYSLYNSAAILFYMAYIYDSLKRIINKI